MSDLRALIYQLGMVQEELADKLDDLGTIQRGLYQHAREDLEDEVFPPDEPPDDPPDDPPVRPPPGGGTGGKDVLGPAFDSVPYDGDFTLSSKLVLGGMRSCLFGGMNSTPARVVLRDIDFRSAEIGNTGWDLGGLGTWWVWRGHNVQSVDMLNCTAQNIFAGRYKGEGHVIYLNVIGGPDNVIGFENLEIENCGGHGIQLVESSGKRAHEGMEAVSGGLFSVKDSTFRNTDIWPGRGSFTISSFGIKQAVSLRDVVVVQDARYFTGYKDGVYTGTEYASRGAFNFSYQHGDVSIEGGTYSCKPPSDRPVGQCSSGSRFEMDGVHVPYGRIFVNPSNHMRQGVTPTTSWSIRRCTGDAEFWTSEQRSNGDWFNKKLGNITEQLNGTW